MIEKPETKGQTQPQNIFDKIEEIDQILKKPEITPQEKERLWKLLTEITEETKKTEGKVISFFNDHILTKLQTLMPNHPFFQQLQEHGAFVDSIDLLIDGDEAYRKILDNIKNAEHTIYINIFIWRDDAIGNRIAKALLEAADRGVKITIVKDALGAVFEKAEETKQSFFHKKSGSLQSTIIDFAYQNVGEAKSRKQKVNPLVERMLTHPNITVSHETVREDHSKYYIFDDETIITGGMNIGDEYMEWHDYMVECKSPTLVQKFRERLSGQDDFDEGSSVEFGVNIKSDTLQNFEVEEHVLRLLEKAEREITIEMAYFGDIDITRAIIAAANEGKKVNIILPAHANVQDDLNKKVMKEIIDGTGGNVNVYFYPGMVHAKVIHIDGQYTFFGSANLNTKATTDLQETNMLINDKDCQFTREIAQQLKEDMQKSQSFKSPPRITFSQVKAYLEAKV